jgi:hypothetical protein
VTRPSRLLPVLALLSGCALAGCGAREPVTDAGPPTLRRLTEAQYRQTVADVFGPDITIAGRFEPDHRRAGLLAVGTGQATVSPAGFEQYDAMARTVAAQVVDEAHRGRLVGCAPADPARADPACAGPVLARYGRLLFRRPLSPAELDARLRVAQDGAGRLGGFYPGLELALASLLDSPAFLFRREAAVPDPAQPGRFRLDGFAKASRLSFLLWNASPDDALLAAAERGELDSEEGLRRQVDRLMASPRLESGVRAFFADFLGFDGFEQLAKDPLIYPKYSQKVAADAMEQTLRTVTGHLLAERGDYRDLFTTRRTFLDRTLGLVYYVPVASRDGWEPYEFAADDPRAGLLTQLSFTMLHAHPGRSSPTLRGKAIRETLLCQSVPVPPAAVNFSIIQDTANPQLRTARDRLGAHSTDPTCAGCHKIIDPVGLALEQFDGLGQVRHEENGAAIDASGELDGARFADAAGLGRALHDNPETARCLVGKLVDYATGRPATAAEAPWTRWLDGRFAADGYRLPDLLRRLATSPHFYAVAPPAPGATTREATS